jgi:preprotein translocase subunit SecD
MFFSPSASIVIRTALLAVLSLLLSVGVATGQSNDASIMQEGDNNDARITQTTAGNTGTIEQVGDDNEATLLFEEQRGNTGMIMQHGDDHDVGLVVDGYDNIADIRQFGTNKHTIGFAGTADNPGRMFQSGNHNEIYVVQQGNADGHVLRTAGEARYIQHGDDNRIDLTQRGSNQLAELRQRGDGNTMTITQDGPVRNTATVHQLSDRNRATITQNGSGNTATVTQE